MISPSNGTFTHTHVRESSRKLTGKQKELLQLYADDVEGRAPVSKAQPTESTSSAGGRAQAIDESGATSSTSSSEVLEDREGGVLSRTWRRIRGLIGF